MTRVSRWMAVGAAIGSLAAGAAIAADLSGGDKREAIDAINGLLAENYVYPETAEKMARGQLVAVEGIYDNGQRDRHQRDR